MKSMFLETTGISAAKSVGEIIGMLAEAGATSVNQSYDAGRITGISFSINTIHGPQFFSIPARTGAVLEKLMKQRGPRSRTPESEIAIQAERIAWRQLATWCKAQLAIIDLGMVQTSEVFMPYMVGASGRTMWEDFSNVKQLPAGNGKGTRNG